jgi:PTS system nitrogen regulatory IIA component
MKIEEFLSADSVLLDMRFPDKLTLLRELSQRAASRVSIPADTIFNELSKREALGSTGIGEGVAIPHARLQGLSKPFAFAARLKPQLNFESIDDRPVDLVFLLLTPAASSKDHLNALATVSRKLRDRAVVEALRASPGEKAFYDALTRAK